MSVTQFLKIVEWAMEAVLIVLVFDKTDFYHNFF